jgi:uncharacterized membrane protein
MRRVQAPIRSGSAEIRSAPLSLQGVLGEVALNLGTAVAAPAALLAAALTVYNVPTAVIAALGWMVGVMGWRWATRRPVSGLLLLTVVILTIKTAFTLVTGNTFVYFAQPVLVDITLAVIFLASLWSTRPVVARLAPEFCPMDAEVASRPRVRAHFRRLTLMWGLVVLVKGSITLWLLETLSTVDFVLIKGGVIITLTLAAVAVTVAWSVKVGRREGLLRPSAA